MVPSSNLAFFFGPGFPLTLGTVSSPKATPELLFTPFFLTPSVGGGIELGTGVPFGAGVFEFDSDGLSPAELAAAGNVFDVVDNESFNGDSSLTGVTDGAAKVCRFVGDNFRVTIRLPFDDFLRPPEAGEGLVVDTIVEVAMKLKSVKKIKMMVAGWRFGHLLRETVDRWVNGAMVEVLCTVKCSCASSNLKSHR
jgi:hypothetical protein